MLANEKIVVGIVAVVAVMGLFVMLGGGFSSNDITGQAIGDKCRTDNDCGSAEVCVNNACAVASTPCKVDSQCASGEVCLNYVCAPAPAPACSDSDGGFEPAVLGTVTDASGSVTDYCHPNAASIVIEHTCAEPEGEKYDCVADGLVCNNGACGYECTEDFECDSDEFCNSVNACEVSIVVPVIPDVFVDGGDVEPEIYRGALFYDGDIVVETDGSFAGSEVFVDTASGAVVVNGLSDEHSIFVENLGNGVVVCPNAESIADMTTTCAANNVFTHAECNAAVVKTIAGDIGISCSIAGNQYGINGLDGSGGMPVVLPDLVPQSAGATATSGNRNVSSVCTVSTVLSFRSVALRSCCSRN